MHPLLRKLVEGCFTKMRINKKEKGIQQGIQYKREARGVPRKTLQGDPRTIAVNIENNQA